MCLGPLQLSVSVHYNYPQCQALESVTALLARTPGERPDAFILECLQLILQNNYFDFNGLIYQQIKGTSVGFPVRPV